MTTIEREPQENCQSKLSIKQAAFVTEYLVDMNATQAAIRAGYSIKSAASQAERLLRNVEIRQAIDTHLAKLANRAEITAESVLRARARIAFADVRRICDEKGRILMPHELDDDTAAAIVSFKIDMDGRIEYRFSPKDSSLTALEKRLGLTEKAIRFPLPDATDIEGCALAQDAVLQAVAAGNLLQSEGQALAGLIENKRRALENHDLAQRLEAIEEKLLNLKGTAA